jgi:hypothetical protein
MLFFFGLSHELKKTEATPTEQVKNLLKQVKTAYFLRNT